MGDSQKDSRADGVETTLELLSVIDAEHSHTQRGLAARLGIALGLTNALVKRAVRKGLIKIHDAPARRYAYYLTAEGFREKSRLVSEYLSSSLDFFRRSRTQYEDVLDYCARRGWKKVLLVRTGELAEIASLAAHATGFSLGGIIDEGCNKENFCGLPVFKTLETVGDIDAVIITDLKTPQQTFDALLRTLPEDRILAPSFLHVSRPVQATKKDAEGAGHE